MSIVRAPTRGRGGAGDNWLAATLILGSVMNPINTTTMAVALTPIGIAFDAPPAETAWLVSAFYLATAVGQPVAGRLVDIVGARRTFVAATSLIGLAGALGTLATDLWVLIAARVLLGLGTSAAYPAAMSVIRSEGEKFGASRQTGLLTILAVSNQALAAIGPVVGGVLLSGGSWPLIFAINLPLAAVCLGLGLWRLPHPVGGPAHEWVQRLDLAGVALFCAALTALMLSLMKPGGLLPYSVTVTLAAGAALAYIEWRRDEPFIDVRMIIDNVPLTVTFVRQSLSLSASFCYVYGFTQWLADVRGLSATMTGLMVAPLFLVSILVSTVLARSQAIWGRLVIGATASALGCLVILSLHDDSSMSSALTVGLLLGVAQGLNGPALQMSVFVQSQPERIGTSAGLLRTSGYIGAMISSGAVAASFPSAATSQGLHQLSWFMLAASGLLLIVSLADPTIRRNRSRT